MAPTHYFLLMEYLKSSFLLSTGQHPWLLAPRARSQVSTYSCRVSDVLAAHYDSTNSADSLLDELNLLPTILIFSILWWLQMFKLNIFCFLLMSKKYFTTYYNCTTFLKNWQVPQNRDFTYKLRNNFFPSFHKTAIRDYTNGASNVFS